MQTAVELLKQDLDSEIKLGTKMVVNWDMYLEMERLQLIDAQSYAISNADMTNNRGYFDCDKWYSETYGSKGSNENFKQFSLYEHKETIATADTPTSSQTEISDEEIWKQAEIFASETTIYGDYEIGEYKGQLSGFFEGAKWYREQLKKKQ